MSFGGGSGGQIRYTISVDDSQAVSKLQGIDQQLKTLGTTSQQSTQQLEQMPSALDQVSASGDNVAQSQQKMSNSVDQATTAAKKQDSAQKSWGSTLKNNIFAITSSVGSILSLVQQYTSLQRAQVQIQRQQNIEIGQRNKIIDLTNKHEAAIRKFGAGSQEALKIERDLQLLQQKHEVILAQLDLRQQQLNERIADFGLNILPNLVGAGGGIAQVIIGLKGMQTGADAAGKASTAMGIRMKAALVGTGIGAVLVGIGATLVIIGKNTWGVTDALNAFGSKLGQLFPQLQGLLGLFKQVEDALLRIFGGEIDQQAAKTAGSIANVTDATGDLTLSGKELAAEAKEDAKALDAMGEAGTKLWLALGGEKKERMDILDRLGLKGLKGIKGLTSDIKHAVDSMKGLSDILQFEFELPAFDKLFVLPKGMTKKLAYQVSHMLQDLKKHVEPEFKKQIGELQDKIKEDAKKGGKNTGQIIGQFLIDHPALYNALVSAGLLSPEVVAWLDKQAADLSEAAKVAFQTSGGNMTDEEKDEWWAKNLPMGDDIPPDTVNTKVDGVIDQIRAGIEAGDWTKIEIAIRTSLLDPLVLGLETIGTEVIPILLTGIKTAIQNTIKNRQATGELATTWQGFVSQLTTQVFTFKGLTDEPKNPALENWISTQVGLFKISIKQGVITMKNWLIQQKEMLPVNDAVNFFSNNVITPIVNAWDKAKKGFDTFFAENPVIEKLKAGDILGAATLAVKDVNTWFAEHIATPIGEGWANLYNGVQEFIKDPKSAIFSWVKSAEDVMGKIIDLAKPVTNWFKTNIGDKITAAWDGMVKLVQSYIFGQKVEGDANGNAPPMPPKPGGREGETRQDRSGNIWTYRGGKWIKSSVSKTGSGADIPFDPSFQKTPSEDKPPAPTTNQFAPVIAGAQAAQKALANLAVQGANSVRILANAILKNTSNLMGNFSTIAKLSQMAQKALGNLGVQGGNSFRILANTIAKNTNNLLGNFPTIQKELQKTQKAFANLAVQGSNSTRILANTTVKNMGSIIKSVQNAQRAIISLIKTIGNMKSKTITVTTNNVQTFKTVRLQHGFHGMVNSPVQFMAGEAGPEYVSVTPMNQAGGGSHQGTAQTVGTGQIIVNLTNVNFDRETTRTFRRELGKDIYRFGPT